MTPEELEQYDEKARTFYSEYLATHPVENEALDILKRDGVTAMKQYWADMKEERRRGYSLDAGNDEHAKH